MHLDDERIQRLLHGELGPVESETRLHLARCEACSGLLEEARLEEERVFALLSRVDHPIPAVDPPLLIAGRPKPASRWGRRAAAVLLGAVLAGVAYATPGSPLPRLVERLLGLGREEQPRPPASQVEGPSPATAGIAVPPAEGLVIELLATGDDAAATVALTGEQEVTVRAVEGVATFSSDPGRLTVRSSGRARLEILIPHAATSVEVRVGDVPVFRKLAGGAVTALPRDSTGRYRIPLRP